MRWLGVVLVALAASLPVLRWLGVDLLGARSSITSEEAPYNVLPPFDLRLPQFKVTAAFRNREGGGVVVQIENKMPDVKDVVIICQNPINKTARKYTVRDWPAGKTIDLGDFDGWDFAMGQGIFVLAPGYKPATSTLSMK